MVVRGQVMGVALQVTELVLVVVVAHQCRRGARRGASVVAAAPTSAPTSAAAIDTGRVAHEHLLQVEVDVLHYLLLAGGELGQFIGDRVVAEHDRLGLAPQP